MPRFAINFLIVAIVLATCALMSESAFAAEKVGLEQVLAVDGSGAFVVSVDETISFADKMIKKLVLETAGLQQAPVQLGARSQ